MANMRGVHYHNGLGRFRSKTPLTSNRHRTVCRAALSSVNRRELFSQPSLRSINSERRDGKCVTVHALGEATALLTALQGGTATLGAYLDSAPTWTYLLYMFGAGIGLPFSEDAMSVWVAARMFNGVYASWEARLGMFCILYFGIVASDMLTFGIGRALKMGLFKSLKEQLLKGGKTLDRAVNVINRFSGWTGAVQRVSVGFRGPLCLMCGFMGVSPWKFMFGAAMAAPFTMSIQFFVGYLLRECPNVYLTALAIVAGPNLIGHAIGPILTAAGVYFAMKSPTPANPPGNEPQPQAT